jgi:hypothetical protein
VGGAFSQIVHSTRWASSSGISGSERERRRCPIRAAPGGKSPFHAIPGRSSCT